MNQKINILLTFDYELFQGEKSGSVANCLLIPTAKILDILDRYNATAVFFIDMMYLCRLKEVSERYPVAKADFEKVENQIIEMAERGHYVYNHIHPHWLDAVYDDEINQWRLTDVSKYSFSSLDESEKDFVFGSTMNLLNEVLQKASKRFLPEGFRAGGLYIQPFSAFRPYFEKHHILYDFSVLSGAKGELADKANSFDFGEVSKDIYKFSSKVEVEDENGPFIEYALRFVRLSFFPRLLNSLLFRLTKNSSARRKYGNGSSTYNKIMPPHSGRLSILETYSIEMLNEVKLGLYFKEANERKHIHIISHPKLVSKKSLDLFNSLLYRISQLGLVEYDFRRFNLS